MIILYVDSDCGIHFLFTDLIVMKLVYEAKFFIISIERAFK